MYILLVNEMNDKALLTECSKAVFSLKYRFYNLFIHTKFALIAKWKGTVLK